MAWYLNRALSNFRAEVNERYPRRDKASDGTIGDEAHQASRSDHNPDADGSVDAWDMDVEVNGPGKSYASDVEKIKRTFEAHEASHYWIHNDRIAFRSEGWKPRSYAYAGPNRNRHNKHVHFNTRESHERSTKPWFKEEDMPLSADDLKKIGLTVATWDYRNGPGTEEAYKVALRAADNAQAANAAVARVEAKVDALAAKVAAPQPIDVHLDVSTPAVADAIAKAVADELNRRLES